MRWLSGVVFVVGLALTVLFLRSGPADPATAWSGGALVVAESGTPAADGWERAGWIPLPQSSFAQQLARGLAQSRPGPARALRRSRQTKVIACADLAAVVGPEALASGRLPEAGQLELLAGHLLGTTDEVTIGGRTWRVVGRLRAEPSPLARAFLAWQHPSTADVFALADDVRPVKLLSAEERNAIDWMKDPYPSRDYTVITSDERLPAGQYYGGLVGLALLLGGGAGWLALSLLRARARAPRWLAPVVEEAHRYRALFAALHVGYYGLIVLAMVVIYWLPALQDAMLYSTAEQIQADSGLLALAGKAYGSGNVALAAVTTFLVNLLAGSLGMITAPSLIIPGSGALTAFFRAAMWGLLLAPSRTDLAPGMVPHSLTLLLEGEGYVIAMFLGVLVPVHLLRREGGTLVERFRGALILNFRGTALVGGLLLVAAIYEAVEVLFSR